MSSYGGFISEIIQTPLVDDGKAVELELVIRRPFASGPYPTLVFNHGFYRLGATSQRCFVAR